MASHRRLRPARRGLAWALALGTAAAAVIAVAAVHLAQDQSRAARPVSSAATAHSAGAGHPASQDSQRATAASTGICTSADHPKLAARISSGIKSALHGRKSVVGLKAVDAGLGLTCEYDQTRHFDSASVIKATIISALLLKIGGPSHLTADQKTLAWEMITESDDDAATALWNEVGMTDMQRFLNAAKMTHTKLNTAWGLSQLTAQDEVTLLQLLTRPGGVLSSASRRYVLYLMAHVIADQRWGTPAGAPSDVTVHVKNGWLPYPDGTDDWHINSIGAFTGTGISYQMAVLTSGSDSMAYGIDTIQGAARVINRDVAGFKS